ncbi:Gfo/Idh/MocA family protein [Vallitalea okinawensis]|uniref:Gfo/Idh/MocA family protein n=1 Tax=Vallitalea okinawensis TaxID=2078660 RepID=UPI000CFB7493|nr:Gfo/Idh/MocA family oxidoreductase [Vallitalea okinawensis]
MLNIAMLSGWHVHAKGYADEVNNSGIGRVTTIWDEVEERGQDWANEINATFVNDLEAIWSDDSIDGVVVCTPTNMHADIFVAAANAKKHIFTEKVMALTMEECEEIEKVVNEHNILFSISYPHRTKSHNLFAKKAIEEGYIGQPTMVRIRNAHNGSIDNWLPQHFYNKEQCGGGAMIDLGAHGMYLSTWLLGQPRSIVSMFTNVTDVPVEDNAVSVIEFDHGAMAINETGFVTPYSPFSIEVYGTKGSIIIKNDKVTIKSPQLNAECPGWIDVSQLPASLKQAIPTWLGAIKGEEEIVFNIQDAIVLTRLMVGAYTSHQTGKKYYF